MIVVGLLSTVHAGAVSAPGAENNPSAIIDVQVSVGQLTVDLRDAPLAQVLQLIGERACIEVTLHGDFSAPVTQAFAALPLEEGIRRLAGGRSVAVTYGAAAGESGQAMLTRVWVMGKSSPGAGAASDSSPSSPKDEQADSRVAEATESQLAPQIGEIQRLADDAGRGGETALARLTDIGALDADAALRQQAVAALGRLTSSAVEPALVAALADTDVEVRLRAVRGLRRFGTDTAVQSIAEVSLADADPQVRLAAVTALTSLPGGSMRRGLARASSDPDEVVRGVAIRGLAWWNTRVPFAP